MTESIGERIVRIRKERGITQKEFSAIVGVTQPVISDYERGILGVHGDLLIQFAKILKTHYRRVPRPGETAQEDRTNQKSAATKEGSGDREASQARPIGTPAHHRGVPGEGGMRGNGYFKIHVFTMHHAKFIIE